MTLDEFKASLTDQQPQPDFKVPLEALWYDAKGDWDQAHQLVDQLNDLDSCLIHAYLHRKEGDLWNADYWYQRAKSARPQHSLAEEWEQLVLRFL